jgi:hypothetical protein
MRSTSVPATNRLRNQPLVGALLGYLADLTARLRNYHVFATNSIEITDGLSREWARITDYVGLGVASRTPCDTHASDPRQ